MRIWLLAVAIVACRSSSRESAPAPSRAPGDMWSGSGSGNVAEAHFGAPRADDEGTLSFAITKVVPGQQPSEAPPWHAGGGTWTYFEASVAGGGTFAALVPQFSGDMFGNMLLVPTTSAGGAKLVEAFAKAFKVKVPPPIAGGQLGPLKMHLAVLAQHAGRGEGFSGSGTWTATKWFCSAGAVEEAEVFFNFSLDDRKGELSEKDSEYDQDIATCLAIAFRDGQPPPRTPANDPTLSATGPELVIGKRVGSRSALAIAVTAKRVLLADDDGTHGTLIAIDPATGAASTVYKSTDRIDGGSCDATATTCVLGLSTPGEARNMFTGKDKARAILLAGTTTTPVPIEEPKMVTLSPDGKWVVASGKTDLVAWNRTTKKTVTAHVGDDFSRVYGWTPSNGHMVAQVERSSYSPEVHRAFTWDLDGAGKLVDSKDVPPEEDESAVPTSPGGTRRADFTKDGKLVVTPLRSGTPRTLAFHPADAAFVHPGCCAWLDERYLAITTKEGFGFIDTDAMKVHYVARPTNTDEAQQIHVAPGMQIAVVRRGDGMYLGTIQLPK